MSARSVVATQASEQIESSVDSVRGLSIQFDGVGRHLAVGDRVTIQGRHGKTSLAEIISCGAGACTAMIFGELEGLGSGARIVVPVSPVITGIDVDASWIGRVIDPLGCALDGRGALTSGPRRVPLRCAPPAATTRARLGPRVVLGVGALDVFVACREGQRLGLFAGPGTGKSTLISMIARNSEFDVNVVAMIGERGREVREFIEDDLGDAGLKKSVVVVATSDMNPLLRRDALYSAVAIAEFFRDSGKRVLLLVDSVTRFCHALREIALSGGEMPNYRSYPSSVFSELPKVLERPGTATEGVNGSITTFFSVLSDDSDLMDPVSNAVRGIIDGHIILDQSLADRGQYPAVDVVRSLSRTAQSINSTHQTEIIAKARNLIATSEDIRELARLGMQRKDGNLAAEAVLAKAGRIFDLLKQDKDDTVTADQIFAEISAF